jgi:hypothetical protein
VQLDAPGTPCHRSPSRPDPCPPCIAHSARPNPARRHVRAPRPSRSAELYSADGNDRSRDVECNSTLRGRRASLTATPEPRPACIARRPRPNPARRHVRAPRPSRSAELHSADGNDRSRDVECNSTLRGRRAIARRPRPNHARRASLAATPEPCTAPCLRTAPFPDAPCSRTAPFPERGVVLRGRQRSEP